MKFLENKKFDPVHESNSDNKIQNLKVNSMKIKHLRVRDTL